MSEYSMGYYGGDADDYTTADAYEYERQRQQNAPRTPGLRQHLNAITRENATLKKQLDEQKAMLQELMEGDSQPGTPAGGMPPLMTQAEQADYQHMLSQGTAQVAAPMGTQAEQIARIRNAKSPDELMEYLRSQGNTNGTQSYNGQGFSY